MTIACTVILQRVRRLSRQQMCQHLHLHLTWQRIGAIGIQAVQLIQNLFGRTPGTHIPPCQLV